MIAVLIRFYKGGLSYDRLNSLPTLDVLELADHAQAIAREENSKN